MMVEFKKQYLPKTLLFLIALTFVPVSLTGCGGHTAINRTENYIYAWPRVNYTSNVPLLVGVIDKRPYVINGKVKPSYVGLMRGGFGNPWYMHTESGQPLSDDLYQAVSSGYRNAGFVVDDVKSSMNHAEITSYFASKRGAKKILIKILEWKSDTYKRSKFNYDLSALIYDENGEIIAETAETNLKGNSPGEAVVSPLDAGRGALSKLLNNKQIKEALTM